MKNCNTILTKKLQKYQYYIYKYEFLTDKEILPPDESRIIEQAKLTYSPLGKTLETKKTKTIEHHREKQI